MPLISRYIFVLGSLITLFTYIKADPGRVGIARYSQNITTDKGNCNFEEGTYRKLAAVGPKVFESSIACGLCLKVTTPKATIVAGVVDLCLGCDPSDILLDDKTFEELGSKASGAIPVQWEAVPCRAEGTIRFSFLKGSSAWWSSIGIRNAVAPVRKLETLVDEVWYPIKKEYYNYFTMKSPGPGPFTFRMTSYFNEVLVENFVPLMSGSSYKSKAQFRTKEGHFIPLGDKVNSIQPAFEIGSELAIIQPSSHSHQQIHPSLKSIQENSLLPISIFEKRPLPTLI